MLSKLRGSFAFVPKRSFNSLGGKAKHPTAAEGETGRAAKRGIRTKELQSQNKATWNDARMRGMQ